MIIYIAESRIAHFIGIDGHRVKNFDTNYGTRSFILNHLRVADDNGVVWVPVELRHMDANSKTERLARLAPVQRFLEHTMGVQYIAFKWPPFEGQHTGVPESLDPAFSRRPEDEYDIKIRGQSTQASDDNHPQAAFDRMRRSSDVIGISPEALKLKQQLKNQRECKERGNDRSHFEEHQSDEVRNCHYNAPEHKEYHYAQHDDSKENDRMHNGRSLASPPRKGRRESRSPEKKRRKEDHESRASSRHHRSSRRSRSRTRSRTRSPSPSRKRKSRRARSYSSSRSPSPRRSSAGRSDKHRDRSSRRSRHESRSQHPKKESPVKARTTARDKSHVKDYDGQRKEQDEKRKNRFGKNGDLDGSIPIKTVSSHFRSNRTTHRETEETKYERQELRSPKKDNQIKPGRCDRDDYDVGYHDIEISTMILNVPELGKVNESRLKMMMADETNADSEATHVGLVRHHKT